MLHDVLLRRRSVLNLSLPLAAAVRCAVFRAAGNEYYPAKLAAKQRESAVSTFSDGAGANSNIYWPGVALQMEVGLRGKRIYRKVM